LASQPGTYDWFGESVAISGNTAFVGARLDDTTAGVDAGSVYVYVGGEAAPATAPDLALEINGPSSIEYADAFNLAVNVTNDGPSESPGFSVQATIGAGLTVVSSSLPPGCSASAEQPESWTTVTCSSSAPLALGATRTVDIPVKTDTSDACTIYGTSGPDKDRVTGTPGADTICGLGGDDEIDGGGGNDTIWGDSPPVVKAFNATADATVTSALPDPVQVNNAASWERVAQVGVPGLDKLKGGPGNDQINGQGRRDELSGGSGTDVLNGGIGDDRMFGEQGPDQLYGADGNDSLFGGDGADTLDGGAHWNTLNGGAGVDQCTAGPLDKPQSGCESSPT
jgi:Ca2+-binding RTX toxin-like protein